ncbi:MAG: hypothetical protein HN348_27105 [Proteobacteria bacterium]|nr:hypothetical protein [Pseudomonadota bacterium]
MRRYFASCVCEAGERPYELDPWFEEDKEGRQLIPMTRAISIVAPPEQVWPWLCQMGRGAGWYTYDRLDNGGIKSAQHLVSWIPEPRLGDAAAVGYLREIRPHEMGWWLPGETQLGAELRMGISMKVSPEGSGTRLVIRVMADARGIGACVLKNGFIIIDSIMARGQLMGIKALAEGGPRGAEGETGARDQYQSFDVVYASGERAGTPGQERAPDWSEAGKKQLGERFGLEA